MRLPHNLRIAAVCVLAGLSVPLLGAPDATAPVPPTDPPTPVADPANFPSTNLIHTPTTRSLERGTLEFLIFHRFGSARTGVEDFFGLDDGANVELGLAYGLSDRLSLGIARITDLKTYEAHGKFAAFQERPYPVALSVFVAFGQETTEQIEYGGAIIADPARVPQTGVPFIDAEINEANRQRHTLSAQEKQSYLGALLVSRRLGPVALQFSPIFVHRNHVPQGLKKDRWGLALGGRIRLGERLGILVETMGTPERDFVGDDYGSQDRRSYADQQNLTSDQINSALAGSSTALPGIILRNVVYDRPVPYYYVPLSLALDIDTGGHIFQIVISNSRRLAATQMLRGADFDYRRRDYVIGFNISRVFWPGNGGGQ